MVEILPKISQSRSRNCQINPESTWGGLNLGDVDKDGNDEILISTFGPELGY